VDTRCRWTRKDIYIVPRTKVTYSEEFKREVLAYQASTGSSFKATAAHFGITANSLREWRRRAASPLGGLPAVAATETPDQELTRLRRENRELQMRCEILKKTVGIFSVPSGNDLPPLKR
jgi:transposase